jgi:malonyl-CoA O-methyltransferase
MHTEETAMLSLLPPLEGLNILDLACGTGRYSLIAQKRGARLVTGVDNSPHMLEKSPISNKVQAIFGYLPFRTGSIDVILCGLAIGHLSSIDDAFVEMGRALKVDGVALISDVHPFIVLNGAKRTFNAGNQVFSVEHYPHLYADIHRAAGKAGLYVDAVLEPTLDESPVGKDVPVAIAYRLRKQTG